MTVQDESKAGAVPFKRTIRRKVNFQLSLQGRDLLERLAKANGLSQSGMIEILVRDRARAEGLLPLLKGITPGSLMYTKPQPEKPNS